MRWVSAVLACCLLAALAASWWFDRDEQPDHRLPAQTSSAGTTNVRPEVAVADADATEPGRTEVVSAELERTDGSRVIAPSPRSPTLLVTRGEPPVPVANAEVFYLSERDLDQRNERNKTTYTRWAAPELFGHKLRTDARGMVRLPAGRQRLFCAARKEGEFGFAAALPRDETYLLQLQADEQVEIIARSVDGEPVQTPVAIVQNRPNDRAPTIWRGETDKSGRALVRHFQFVRTPPREGNPESPERFAAVAMVPTEPPVITEFPGRPTTDAPVELVMPPLGQLLVRLVDHEDQPLLSPARVGLNTPRRQREPNELAISRGLLSRRIEKPAGAEPVTLPFVPTGQEISVYARYDNDRRSGRSEKQRGPTQKGETVEVIVRPDKRHCVLAGRLLGPDRRPISESRVAVTIWQEDRVRQTARAYTIKDGRWDLVLSGRTEQAKWRIEFRYQGEGEGDAPTHWLGAKIALPEWPPGTRIDLGTIVLGELPPLIAGIVVDDLGQPIAGATVSVQQNRDAGKQQQQPSNNNTRELELAMPRRYSNRRPRNPWRDLPNLRTKTAADGTFVIDGDMPPGEVRVRADSGKHFADTVPLAAANQSLQIQLDRNGIVSGRVLLPDWIASGAVSLTLRPFEEHRRKAETVRTQVRGGRRFKLEPLRPGRYDLLVTMRNLQKPLATIPDVFVKPGVTDDRRLQPLDLTQSLFRYRLRARDQAGIDMPLDGPIHARLQQLDGTWTEAGFRWQKGRAELITAHQTAELTFFGRGFEPQKQLLAPGEHDIYLRALQPALVTVPGARALCGPTRKVRISAILQGDTGYPSSLGGIDQQSGQRFSFPRWDLGRSSGGWLEASDDVSIPLMKAGKYQIILRAHATESTRTPQVSVTLGTFELKPDGVSRVTVPLDSQAVSEALKRVDQQHRQQQEQRKKRRNR